MARTDWRLKLCKEWFSKPREAADWLLKNADEDMTVTTIRPSGSMEFPVQDMASSMRACAASFPDINYSQGEPKLRGDGSVCFTVQMTGTHTGDPFYRRCTMLDTVPGGIPASHMKVRNDKETFVLQFRESDRRISKISIETLPGGQGFTGRHGAYTQLENQLEQYKSDPVLLQTTSSLFSDMLSSSDEHAVHVPGASPEAAKIFTQMMRHGAQEPCMLEQLNPHELKELVELSLKYNVQLLIDCIARKVDSDPDRVEDYLPCVFLLDRHMWDSWHWSTPVLLALREACVSIASKEGQEEKVQVKEKKKPIKAKGKQSQQQPRKGAKGKLPETEPASLQPQIRASTYIDMLKIGRSHSLRTVPVPEELKQFSLLHPGGQSQQPGAEGQKIEHFADLAGYIRLLKKFVKHQRKVAAEKMDSCVAGVQTTLIEPLFQLADLAHPCHPQASLKTMVKGAKEAADDTETEQQEENQEKPSPPASGKGLDAVPSLMAKAQQQLVTDEALPRAPLERS